MHIQTAQNEVQIRACYAAFHELRPHLSEEAFVTQVQRQMLQHGYIMAYIENDGQVMAGAGCRVAEFLAWGKALYVDDLVTLPAVRNKGYAGALIDWLFAYAQQQGCGQIHLDSGVHRHDAHRLYLQKKFQISSHHFSRNI